jgi:Ca2+-transporting ATPase
MQGGGQNNIPSMNITTEFPSDSPSQPHQVLSSGLLSPHSPTHGRPSPVPSDVSDSGSAWIPPSPTLSNHSGRPFLSTLHLHDNKPEEKSGLSSLGLLNPDSLRRHGLGSATTISISDYVRSDDVHHSHSKTTSVTNVDHLPHSPTNEKRGSGEEGTKGEQKPNKKKKGREVDDIEEDLQTTHQIELDQDAAIDPTPFRYRPYELAHMLDPKNIATLVSSDGIHGLLRGLGTNPDTGLVTHTQGVRLSEFLLRQYALLLAASNIN